MKNLLQTYHLKHTHSYTNLIWGGKKSSIHSCNFLALAAFASASTILWNSRMRLDPKIPEIGRDVYTTKP